MNEAKAINALTNIFHIETYTGENGNYELSSNSWGLHFDVRIRDYTIFIQDGKGARCSIDSDEDTATISQEIVAFIGEVLKDESKGYNYEAGNQILAWPFNCNMAYVKGLVAAMWAMPEGTPLTNSKKPIKSFRDTSTEDTSNKYGFYWEGENIYDKDGNHWYFGDYINGNTGIEPYSSYMQAVKETADSVRDGFWDDEIADPEDYAYALIDFAVETMEDPGKFIKEYEGFVKSSRKPVDSSMQGQERGIQAIMDEYGCTREEAIEIMNNEVTSGCHDKTKKKDKKEIKSSLKDEFEASFSDNSTEWPDDEYNTCLDSFKNEFAKDHNITYEEVDKIYNELQDEWFKNSDNAGATDIYSSATRNTVNLNRIFG